MGNIPKLAKQSGYGAPQVFTKQYKVFKGVDFSTDPSQVADSRSPYAPNLISDTGGFPEKRLGWRTLNTLPGRINGIYFFEQGETTHMLVHSSSGIYRLEQESEPLELIENIHDSASCGFAFGGKFYILTGGEYLAYDGKKMVDACTLAYVPTTSIPKSAEVQEIFQGVNLLTPRRKNLHIADGTKREFILDATVDLDSVVEVRVNDLVVANYTISSDRKKIVFSTAPGASNPAGTPNVSIEFSHTVTGYRERITKCTIAVLYAERVFFSGNPGYPGMDWHSGVDVVGIDSAAYIEDISYAQVGADSVAIMGYLRSGESLAIVKAENDQDANIFLRTRELGDTGYYFPVKQGVAGVGAVSAKCMLSLLDDPLFLASTGVYGIHNAQVGRERTVQQRSGFVNARLAKELKLKEACAITWNGYYVLCVNGNAYIADSRQKSYRSGSTSEYEYEWYFWTNVPACTLKEYDGVLYFGCADGRVCRFNSDMVSDKGEIMMAAYNDDGQEIVADWATKLDDDGDFMSYKTLIKKGSGILLKTYTRSGVKMLIKTEKDFGRLIKEATAGVFNWNDLDFNHFTFNTLPQNIIPFNAKVKKYKLMQIVCRNDQVNQGFGVYAIEKRYVRGNYVK